MNGSALYQAVRRFYFGIALVYYSIFDRNNIHGRTLAKWMLHNGDNNFLITYPLHKNSIVYDVGGYKGNFTFQIQNKYHCTVVVFEPVKQYYSYLKNRFKTNRRVILHNFGLSDKTITAKITLDEDGSSYYAHNGRKGWEHTQLMDIAAFLRSQSNPVIDLMSINIEGGEYGLLQRMITEKLLTKVRFLQVQFHEISVNSEPLRKSILRQIDKTHNVKYSYPFVWECFERNTLAK